MVLPVTPGQLPSGFCPTDFQGMLNGFSAVQSVNVSPAAGATSVVVSSTKPTDQTVLWLRTDQFGRPERVYYFASGAWLSLHPSVPGTTIIWTDVLPNFTTFDGGDALALSAISGAMWEAVTDLAARFPVGTGTLPSGTVIAVGDKSGEEKHVLLPTELAVHSHGMTQFGKATASGETADVAGALVARPSAPGFEISETTDDFPAVATVGHQNMPPYLGVTFLRRTVRQFYVIP